MWLSRAGLDPPPPVLNVLVPTVTRSPRASMLFGGEGHDDERDLEDMGMAPIEPTPQRLDSVFVPTTKMIFVG